VFTTAAELKDLVAHVPRAFSDWVELLSIGSCAGLTRASILALVKMDCRVKPGNDREIQP
jgi:hypothetical protein